MDNLRVAQWIFSTYQPFSITYPNDRVRNNPPTWAFFWKYYSLKLHVTLCRTSRVISPKLCHALFSMSRVKSGEFCHGQCHALFWGSKSVTGYFSCHGRFFRKLSRVSKKMSRGKNKTMDLLPPWFIKEIPLKMNRTKKKVAKKLQSLSILQKKSL